MTKSKYTVLYVCCLAIFAWIGLSRAQQAKTLKLPNGEVVVDIRGEWDDQAENYGPWSKYGKYSNILKISLEGNSFVGIRKEADAYHDAGSVAIQVELDKNGIKNVQIMSGAGPLEAKGEISDDGNKIVIDDGEKAKLTLIRK
jgi:hypothetical protein